MKDRETSYYQFFITKPSAKRLETNREFVAKCWCFGTHEDIYPIPETFESFVWEGPKVLDHREPEVLDGDYRYQFKIIFSNSTKTRQEEVEVFPTEIKDPGDIHVLDSTTGRRIEYF